jgi:hypothetical protein
MEFVVQINANGRIARPITEMISYRSLGYCEPCDAIALAEETRLEISILNSHSGRRGI